MLHFCGSLLDFWFCLAMSAIQHKCIPTKLDNASNDNEVNSRTSRTTKETRTIKGLDD